MKLRYVVCLALLMTAVGCVTGPPKPASCIRKAVKSYKEGNVQSSLENFQYVMDTTPWALEKRRFSDELAIYRDAQIQYAASQSTECESAGRLLDAWIWSVQGSLVDEERDECRNAKENAERIRQQIAENYSQQARGKVSEGNVVEALSYEAQAYWFGAGQLDESIFGEKAISLNPQMRPWVLAQVSTGQVAGMVRTDSLERLLDVQHFAPYGLPVYFGDVPKYYVRLGTITVKGMPFTRPVPAAYSKLDALRKLTLRAQKKFKADALVNVHYWTKSKKAFTQGDAVKFVELGDTKPFVLTQVGSTQPSPNLPTPSSVTADDVKKER